MGRNYLKENLKFVKQKIQVEEQSLQKTRNKFLELRINMALK